MINRLSETNIQIGIGTDGTHPQGAQGTHLQGAQGTHPQGAQGTHPQGAQGTHLQGAQGMHLPGARSTHHHGAQAEWQDDLGANRRLTVPQKQVLDWLAIYLKGEEKIITCIYQRIEKALGMKKRAVRVHVGALKRKGLIVSKVAYRPNTSQRIGLSISITPDAPIKHLPHKMSETELREMQESSRKSAQVWALIKQGYTYIKELDGFVRESPKFVPVNNLPPVLVSSQLGDGNCYLGNSLTASVTAGLPWMQSNPALFEYRQDNDQVQSFSLIGKDYVCR